MSNPTGTELSHLLAKQAHKVCQHLLPNGVIDHGNWVIGGVSGHAGKSLHVRLDGDKAGVWFDFSSKEKGDMLGLWSAARGLSLKDAYIEAAEFLSIPIESEPKAHSQSWTTIQREMGTGTEHDLTDLAKLRHLPSVDGLRAAIDHRILFFGPVQDDNATHHSWLITDDSRRAAQARRMDGQPWANGGKAKTIHGTEARWPIGSANAAKLDIALVEGGPDLLAAYTAASQLGLIDQIQPVSMIGSGMKIHPEAVAFIANRTVWLFPHDDKNLAGLQGAVDWTQRLTKAGCTVIPFDFAPYGVKDLNEFVSAMAQTGAPA